MLFDAEKGKAVSNPIPFTLFNRSRTAFVASDRTRAAIFNTLSALEGEPAMLAVTSWENQLDRLQFGRLKAVLSEDLQTLIFLPDLASPGDVTRSNFVVEVFSTDGATERWEIPLERNWESFVDAESIDGKIMVLSRILSRGGTAWDVKLTSMQGKTIHSQQIPAFTGDPVWNPGRHELIFPPLELFGLNPKPPYTFHVWDYRSNTVTSVRLEW